MESICPWNTIFPSLLNHTYSMDSPLIIVGSLVDPHYNAHSIDYLSVLASDCSLKLRTFNS